MEQVKVCTQGELDEALKAGKYPLLCGSATFELRGISTVTAYDSSKVMACDSSKVTAYGSSTVRAYDSSTVMACDSGKVTAYGSSTVMACGSSTVRAYGSSKVVACDSSKVRAAKFVTVHVMPPITAVEASTAEEWLDAFRLKAVGGVVVLFKAVRADFLSQRGMSYAPGSTPAAPDWDGGEKECGGGLHFCPCPALALKFDPEATRFVACPVKVSEIIVHHRAKYPEKIKAPRVCEPVWECDIHGNPVRGKVNASNQNSSYSAS